MITMICESCGKAHDENFHTGKITTYFNCPSCVDGKYRVLDDNEDTLFLTLDEIKESISVSYNKPSLNEDILKILLDSDITFKLYHLYVKSKIKKAF